MEEENENGESKPSVIRIILMLVQRFSEWVKDENDTIQSDSDHFVFESLPIYEETKEDELKKQKNSFKRKVAANYW